MNVIRLLLWETSWIVAAGIGAGLPLAVISVHRIENFLFKVTSKDPVTILSAIAVLIFVAGLAAFLPARRASRADPLVALRHD